MLCRQCSNSRTTATCFVCAPGPGIATEGRIRKHTNGAATAAAIGTGLRCGSHISQRIRRFESLTEWRARAIYKR
jgi:hypothetical protein